MSQISDHHSSVLFFLELSICHFMFKKIAFVPFLKIFIEIRHFNSLSNTTTKHKPPQYTFFLAHGFGTIVFAINFLSKCHHRTGATHAAAAPHYTAFLYTL